MIARFGVSACGGLILGNLVADGHVFYAFLAAGLLLSLLALVLRPHATHRERT